MSTYSDLLARLRKKTGPINLSEIVELLEKQTFPADALGEGSVERGVADELRDLGVPVERYGAVSGASDDATASLINASTAEDGTGVVEHHSRALSSPIILKGEGREYRLTSPLVLPPCAALTIRDITLVVDDAFVGTHAIRGGDGDPLYASDALETRITALKLENVTIDCRHVGGVAAKTATYVSATSFSVAGDQTAAFPVGGLVAVNGSATGYIGGVITASVFSSVTTVTVKFNRGSLTNEALTAMPLGIGVGGLYVNRHYTVDIDGLRVLHSAGVAIQSDMDSARVKTSHSFNLRNVDVREWTQYETPHPILGDGFADATKRCGVGLRLDSFDYHLSKVDIGYCAYAFDIKAAGGEFVQFHPYGGFGSIQHVTGAGTYIAHSMSFIGCHFDNIRDVLVRNPYYGMNFVACKFMSFSASSVKFLLLRCESALAARINVTSCIFYQSTVVSGTEALSLDEATASFTSITGVMLGNDFENVTPHEFIGIRSATQTQWNLASKVAGTIASLNLRDAETLKYQLVKLTNNDAGFYDATSGTYAWYIDATSGQIRFDRCKLIRVEYNQVTSANLASASNAVNTTNKAAGTVVELSDGTPGRIMRARGSTPTSPWVDLTGGNTVTPA